MKSIATMNNVLEAWEINEAQQIIDNNEITAKLRQYLCNSRWSEAGILEQRIEQLMRMNRFFISNVSGTLSADEIAKSLFEYDRNI